MPSTCSQDSQKDKWNNASLLIFYTHHIFIAMIIFSSLQTKTAEDPVSKTINFLSLTAICHLVRNFFRPSFFLTSFILKMYSWFGRRKGCLRFSMTTEMNYWSWKWYNYWLAPSFICVFGLRILHYLSLIFFITSWWSLLLYVYTFDSHVLLWLISQCECRCYIYLYIWSRILMTVTSCHICKENLTIIIWKRQPSQW